MAIDIPQALEILQEALLGRLGDEVDLVFRFGSTVKGTAHHYSDIDVAYVPVHEATWDNITVVIEGTLCDLFPIHWSQLERMASFDDAKCTLLLEGQIVYQQTEKAAERFRQLGARLRALLQPESYPILLRRAQEIFQRAGYPYFQLKQQADRGHRLACMQHSRQILSEVTHCLAVCNQVVVDTRKRDQLLALPKLPEGFADNIDRITINTDPGELLLAAESLLHSTQNLLLTEQQRMKTGTTGYPEVFDAAYPELKGDLQHISLACERRDTFSFSFISLYHELMVHIAQASTGIEYSDFNSLADYEQDLTALGFPDLFMYVAARDFDELRRQCDVFDERMQQFLVERGVSLYSFASLDDLRKHLAKGRFQRAAVS